MDGGERSGLLIDATVPLLVGAIIVFAGVLPGDADTRPLALALGLLAAAVLVARRRVPGWTLAISVALVQVLFFLDPAAGGIAVLSPAVALYSLAMRRGRLPQVVGAACAVAAVILADVSHGSHAGVARTVGHVALVAVPLLAAETLRTRRSYVSLLLERIELAERSREQEARRRVEEERLRIARELHDIVAHALAGISVQAATAAHLFDERPDHARAALETIAETSREAMAELRGAVGVLRAGDSAGANFAPAPGIGDVAELVRRACDTGLEVRLDVDGAEPDRLSDAVSLAVYRIVQESLTNARRHAAGTLVRIQLSFAPGELTLAIEHPRGSGAGEADGSRPGVGIIGMTERAVAVGGTLRAAPSAAGFRVAARLPYVLGSP